MAHPNSIYPPANFLFRVYFYDGPGKGSKTEPDKGWGEEIYFQSVSGLTVQMQTETIKEGGENRFEHAIPTRAKYGDLVLKRGIYPADSPMTKWIQDAVQQFIFKPKNIQIQLLDEQHQPMMLWDVEHAWPKNWKMDELNAEQGKIMIETLEFTYNTFRMSNGG